MRGELLSSPEKKLPKPEIRFLGNNIEEVKQILFQKNLALPPTFKWSWRKDKNSLIVWDSSKHGLHHTIDSIAFDAGTTGSFNSSGLLYFSDSRVMSDQEKESIRLAIDELFDGKLYMEIAKTPTIK